METKIILSLCYLQPASHSVSMQTWLLRFLNKASWSHIVFFKESIHSVNNSLRYTNIPSWVSSTFLVPLLPVYKYSLTLSLVLDVTDISKYSIKFPFHNKGRTVRASVILGIINCNSYAKFFCTLICLKPNPLNCG